jgi:hypothetical protein
MISRRILRKQAKVNQIGFHETLLGKPTAPATTGKGQKKEEVHEEKKVERPVPKYNIKPIVVIKIEQQAI